MQMNSGHLKLVSAARYIIYGLLALNIIWYFRAEFAASSELLGASTGGLTTLITVFSETLDTLAWVALVLLFEIEIRFLRPERLRGSQKWLLSSLRIICYAAIIFSLYGYWAMWQTVTTMTAGSIQDACGLADQGYSYLAGLDLYPDLTSSSCLTLANQPLFQLSGTRILATSAQLDAASQAAIVDIVNAVTWLIVVIIMEAEIYLQFPGTAGEQLRKYWLRNSKWVLLALYAILLGCALYWLLYSDFLDFWDAFLWLIAFAFIELDILDWQADTPDHARPSDTPVSHP
jgi:hypothetical protein